MPKLNQCSTYKFNDGWTVENTAMLVEAEKPNREQERAKYLGTTAEYLFCVSSVAMPSSSLYNLTVSSGLSRLAFDLALLQTVRKRGTEVRKISIKATKVTTAERLGECSIGGKKRKRKRVGNELVLYEGNGIHCITVQRDELETALS